MADRKSEDSYDDGHANGEEFVDLDDDTTTVGSAGDLRIDGEMSGSGSRTSLADRLSEILVEEGDGDLLLQQSDRESNFLQWLQALDLQVMGACRADERLKPWLKVNASSGSTEDRLLAHLSQHFEASEVGLLARCLCVPLVSMRVGKVVKQGKLLCPTSMRGNLNLTLLPSSDLRISFVRDDGHTQRLATLRNISECSDVEVQEIPADQSGRSFLVRTPDGQTFYFWCAEKSKLLGVDLLSKMKDLVESKPTLAELTGISESRLECFAAYLRACFVGSGVSNTQASAPAASSAPSVDIRTDTVELGLSSKSCQTSARPLRSRHSAGQASKVHPQYQGSLSPRANSFKEGSPKPLCSLRSASREKLRRNSDLHLPTVDSSFLTETFEKGKNSEALGTSLASSLSFLESLEKASFPPSPSATSQFNPIGSLFSPYYCWCPPCPSPSMSTVPQLPTTLAEPFSLPFSSLLPATGPPSLLTQIPPLNLADVPPLNLPSLVPDPLSGLPFSRQSLQQIPTFTPLMCDPIVHIPVLDVCSSGQGYLVSAGPAISANIPPLHPKMVGPMMPEGDSMVEKGARETLRLLIGGSSSQASTSLMEVLPTVLSNNDKQGVFVAGSRGLYSGVSDVNAIVNSFAAIGLASLSERSVTCSGFKSYGSSAGPDTEDSTIFKPREEEKEDDCM